MERENLKQNLKQKIDCIWCQRTIDLFIYNSKFILPIFLLLIFIIFEVTFSLWNFIAEYLDIFLNYLYWFAWVQNTLINAIFWWITWILVYIPNIIILYFFLFLLKDSWVLSRISYVFDRYLNKIWLTWNSFMSLFMWFWCTIPAILSTKNLTDRKEKILAVMMLPFISCSAKIPVFVLFVSIFIPAKLQSFTLIFIYLIWIIFWIISNFVLSKILRHKNNKFKISTPDYIFPDFIKIFKKIFLMLKEFLMKIWIYILPFSLILTLAFTYPVNEKIENTYWWKIWETLQVVFEPLWFNKEMSISVISWIIWKEITVSTLWSLYYLQDWDNEWLIKKIKEDSSVTIFSALSFLLFMLLYTPCIWAIVTAKNELWKMWWLIFFIYPCVLAWMVSFIVYQSLVFVF